MCSMKYRRRSFIVSPGMGPTPPVTTRVGMPSVCESTAVMVLLVRMVPPVPGGVSAKRCR
jgi:hypothetical protein